MVAKPWFRLLAIAAPLMAVAPVAFGLSGPWIALHLAGGAISLAILLYGAFVLPSPWRAYAAGAIAFSLVVIVIVTSGHSLPIPLQVAVLVLLGATYVACIFRPVSTH